MSGFLTVWDAGAGAPREVPASEAVTLGLPVLCWDEEKHEHVLMPAKDLAEGMFTHARTLPTGSAHRAEVERQALEITEPPWQRKRKVAARKKSGT